MPRRALCLAVAAALLSGARAVHAEGPGPRERAQALAAAFPPPDAKGGFAYRLAIRQGTAVVGTYRLSATPSTHAGAAAWKVEDVLEQTGPGFTRALTAFLSPSLSLLEAREVRTRDGVSLAMSVARRSTGFEVTTGEPGTPGHSKTTVEAPPETTASLPALLLFLRRAPREAATYAWPMLRWEETAILQETVLEVRDLPAFPTPAGPRAAWGATLRRGDAEFVVHLDAADRALLAVTKGDLVMSVEGALEPRSAASTQPPSSAREAVARMALAWASADLPALSAVLDWRFLHAASGSKASLEAFRAEQEALLQERMGEADPSARTRIDEGIAKATESAGPDGTVEVTADFGRGAVSTVARKTDAGWLVVRLPRAR